MECIDAGLLRKINPVNCTETQKAKLDAYYIPRIGEVVAGRLKSLLQCFDKNEFILESEPKTHSFKTVSAIYQNCREYATAPDEECASPDKVT